MRIADNNAMFSLLMATRNMHTPNIAAMKAKAQNQSAANGRNQSGGITRENFFAIAAEGNDEWLAQMRSLEEQNVNPKQIEMTPARLAFLELRSTPGLYDQAFLHGTWTCSNGITRGEAPGIGTRAFLRILGESGVEIPADVRFDISVNRYGGVTITGLEDAELTARIEEAMSYDSRLIHSVLGMFVSSARNLAGHQGNNNPLSTEHSRLIRTQSQLMNHGVGIHDLTLDENEIIRGLTQELHDKIYGDRSVLFEGMNRYQIKRENGLINLLRDDIIHLLRNGTDHIPAPEISLTFDNGRMIVNL